MKERACAVGEDVTTQTFTLLSVSDIVYFIDSNPILTSGSVPQFSHMNIGTILYAWTVVCCYTVKSPYTGSIGTKNSVLSEGLNSMQNMALWDAKWCPVN